MLFSPSDEGAARLHQLLKVGGGAYSTCQPQLFTNPQPGLAAELVLAHLPYMNDDVEIWLGSLQAHASAVVVLSDNREVREAARNAGLLAIGPDTDLTPALLDDLIHAAQAAQTLRHGMMRLQGMYDMAQQRFTDMANQFADWLWEVDSSLTLTFSSSRKRPLAGAGKGSRFVDCFMPEEKLRIEDDFAALVAQPSPFHDRDYWSSDSHGTRYCWSVSGVPVVDGAGRLVGFRGIARDISAQKASTDQLYYLANNDPLTGITNRARFMDELARTLRSAKREKRGGALVVLDLDHFAYTNQTHGHGVGDKLLAHVAQVLKDSIRTGDAVARLDGDQFALLLRDLRADDLAARLERIQGTLAARPFQHSNGPLMVTVSGGAAMYPTDADDADELLARASDALMLAKERGPNRMERYNPEARPSGAVSGQLEWAALVGKALDDPEHYLQLHYQPIVPISGRLQGEYYEALVRMVDESGALIPAIRFISVAEEFGLITKLDRAVVTRAVKALQHYHAVGRPIKLSVNLSAKSFEDESLFEEIAYLLEGAKLPRGTLVLELTETALLRDLQLVKQVMGKLKQVGAGFALDDCGVGYSSLTYIRQLEVDYIKIDGSFVRNLHNSEEDQGFVKAMADLAKQKNIATVAEMVEHEAAVAVLQKLGIDFGQGFHFAAPAAELPEKKAG
ncbi:MAG: EAL domain-containing protein [Pseudomonadaceae bacterium]|nr:EAL domain-containing protein [Pseudomonadaceae bacterium]